MGPVYVLEKCLDMNPRIETSKLSDICTRTDEDLSEINK